MAKRIKTLAKVSNIEQHNMASKDRENFTRQTNPLLVELILENILYYLKENKSTSLGEYRLVCKFWDQEIIKIMRRETHMQLYRILTPYPEGFGWNTVRGLNKYQYKVPYEHVSPFENVEVVFGSRWVKRDKSLDEKFVKWFKVMGHQVKSLIYHCSLKTYQKKHCTTLERVFKEWCPNLERLTFYNEVQGCLKALCFTSLFENPEKEFICKKLTEIKVNMDLQQDWWGKNEKVFNLFKNPMYFNQFIYKHGLSQDNNDFPEISNHAGVKATVAKELLLNSELPDLSKIFAENFFADNFDGGILGQLMKSTNVTKLTLEGQLSRANREHLMAFFHYRQNIWRYSLKYLEINWNSYPGNFAPDFVILGKIKFPIVSLKITTPVFETKNGDLERFLSSFSESLEELDLNISNHFEPSRLVLPLLPRLKIFIINKINICRLSAGNLIECAPNLEKCYLTGNMFYSINHLHAFFEEGSMLIHERLKDFRLTGINVHFSGQQANKILDWFPKLKRLELIGMVDENIGMAVFLQKLGNSEVTDLKISWCRKNQSSKKANINDDTTLMQETGKLRNLVTLDMSYGDDTVPIHVMPVAFRDGFGKLSNLRFLKLKNIGVSLHEKCEVLKYIEHIPVVHLDDIGELNYQ